MITPDQIAANIAASHQRKQQRREEQQRQNAEQQRAAKERRERRGYPQYNGKLVGFQDTPRQVQAICRQSDEHAGR